MQVIEFCKHYKEDPMNEIEKPLKSANMHDVVQEWYAKFVEVQQETLFELILAANYMDIKPLLDLTCATVASMIKVGASFLVSLDFQQEWIGLFISRTPCGCLLLCACCPKILTGDVLRTFPSGSGVVDICCRKKSSLKATTR